MTERKKKWITPDPDTWEDFKATAKEVGDRLPNATDKALKYYIRNGKRVLKK